MIRLTSGALPTAESGKNRGAIASVNSNSFLSPLARLDYYDRYRNPATGTPDFGVAQIPTPLPTWEGYFYRIPIPGLRVRSIPGFLGTVSHPYQLLPGYYWVKDDQLVLYSNNAHPVGETLTIESETILSVPTPDFSYRFRVEGVEEVDITLVESEGLRYFPAENPDSPEVHEFRVVDGILEIYASPTCAPRIGAELVVVGNLERAIAPLARAATFVLDQSIYPEILDYLGKSFTRNLRGWNLGVGEFVWDSQNKRLTAVGI